MVKFLCLVCEKAVGTNHNPVYCDMRDIWVHIYCNKICKKHTEILKKINPPGSVNSVFEKKTPFLV